MRRGDHIYVDLGSFKQHGIYCGNNRVIYWIRNSSEATVRKSSLEEFSFGRREKVKKRNYRHRCSSTNDVIKRAERRLKENKLKYKFSDSKAFAMYCKTGLHVGDHLYVDFGIYYHHGIYYGNDKVAHYSGNKVSVTSLSRFAKGEKVLTKRYKKCSSSKTVARRVKRRLGERKYHLIFNNCEHFSTWCKTRRHRSEQVDDLPKSAAKAIGYIASRPVQIILR